MKAYTLKKVDSFSEAVKVLECFDDTLKFYWISVLPVSEAVKGKVILHFNL